jgi:hypothetical protein
MQHQNGNDDRLVLAAPCDDRLVLAAPCWQHVLTSGVQPTGFTLSHLIGVGGRPQPLNPTICKLLGS